MRAFISYHHEDIESAVALASHLDSAGIATWVASRDIVPGQDWDTAIATAIHQATAVVLVFSRLADGSRNIKRELMLADKNDKPIYMVRLDRVEPRNLAYLTASSQWVDWGSAPDPAGLGSLVAALGGTPTARMLDAHATLASVPRAPYPGTTSTPRQLNSGRREQADSLTMDGASRLSRLWHLARSRLSE